MADQTMLQDLINPEVLAPIVSYTLKKALRFTPLATIDNTLTGTPGDTLIMPAFGYLGDAQDVPEGQPIPVAKLGTTKKAVTVKKAGLGTSITDEASISGYGDPVKESTNQLGLALANKVDNDLLAAVKGGTQTVSMASTVDGIQTALDIFNDEDTAQVVLIVSPKTASALRMDAVKQKIGSDVGANELINGTYADILGVQIIRSRKLADTDALFVKPGALKLVMKKTATVETQRVAGTASTEIYATEHYAPYLFDDTKVVVGTIGGSTKKS
ncbi:N4-gp56 family major capsid protein [Bombilactobacillus folatiphilus]|uniref:N4-gp56 family major capsid protein n=1 Tax=Bombilactobacillus folatiphilus TaxID=2923362 RepID=A0ABY4PBG2_9LACO|nr:N4-gp56 family major capsid protein [Bombilactobacillus folatiphilus]UQS82602.1 N4-gp56 family major capsid protein [Bombilactobacillus folatiphilus]